MIAHSRHTRYYNARTYTFYKDGKVIGSLQFDLKFSEEFYLEELRKFKQTCGADSCYLTWTAREGKMKKEIKL